MSGPITPIGVQDLRPIAPSVDDAGFDGELARAYQRARALSLDVLSGIAPGVDFGAALQRSDGGTLTVRQQPVDIGRLFDPERLLDELLTRFDLDDHRVKIMKDRQRADAELVLDRSASGSGPRLAPGSRLAAVLDEGHTLVLDGIDRRDATLRLLAEHVSRTFIAPLNINGYVSLRPHPSFGAHWDDHEVMILQLIGHKRWVVFEPAELSPKSPRTEQSAVGGPVWDGVIEPGHFLYVPRGWGHDVTGLDKLTFHLTITVPRIVTPELIRATFLRPSEGMAGLAAVSPLVADPAGVAAAVGAIAGEALSDERVDSVLAAFRANLAGCRVQSPRSLVSALSGRTPRDRLWVRNTSPGGILRGPNDDGDPIVMHARAAARVDPEALAVLAPLLDGRVHLADAVERGAADPTAVAAVVDAALRAGLLEVVDEPDRWGLVVGTG